MDKAEKSNQEKPKGLKNSRYWEDFIPKKDEATPKEEGHIPDYMNPDRLKELH